MIHVYAYDKYVFQCKHSVEATDNFGEVVVCSVGSGNLTWVNRLTEQVLSPAGPSSWPNTGFNQSAFLVDFFFI